MCQADEWLSPISAPGTHPLAYTLNTLGQQRPFETQTFSVDQGSGVVSSNALTTQMWYDHRGNEIEVVQPTGLVTKTQYDGAGRTVEQYVTDGGADFPREAGTR